MSTTEARSQVQIQEWVNRMMTAWDAEDLDTVNAILTQPGAEAVGRLAVKGFFSDGELGNGAGLNTFLGKRKEPADVDPRD